MKTSRPTKGERRAHRKAKDRRRLDDRFAIPTHGGALHHSDLESLLTAARALDPAAPWGEVAPRILPILKRVRQPFPPDAEPLHLRIPPGIPTGFGIDLGPAFGHVSAAMVEAWGVDHATLLATALDNLRHLVEREPPAIQDLEFDDLRLTAIQGQGWGSALLLLPDVLRPILSDGPRILLAPVRNAIVALPEDIALDVAAGVWHALAEGAHDELEVEPMRWTGSDVTALHDGPPGRPN